MNLLFWKKKAEAGDDAEDAQGDSSMNKKERESLDFAAAKQGSSESIPESPEQGTPVKTGLVARMKSKFTFFAQHFRKAPAFQAGEDYAPDGRDSLKPAPDDAPAINPDLESSEPEIPANPSLVARIKASLDTLALRFKKAPAPDAEENQDKDTRRRSEDEPEDTEETPKTLSLVERAKSNLGIFVSHHKKLLIFILLLLSLTGIVYAAWNIIFPPIVREPALRSTDEAPIHEPLPPIKSPQAVPPQSEQPQTEAEVLKKKSVEAQSVEAPKKEGSDQAQTEAGVLKKKGGEAQARTEAPKKNSSEQAQAEAEELKNKSEDAQALAEALKKESEDTQTQAETLKKQSEAAQARAEALRKKEAEDKARAEAAKKSLRQQKLLDSSNLQTGGGTAPPQNTGEVTVGSKDPKAAAKSLKEAIEAMNAVSDGPAKKPAK